MPVGIDALLEMISQLQQSSHHSYRTFRSILRYPIGPLHRQHFDNLLALAVTWLAPFQSVQGW